MSKNKNQTDFIWIPGISDQTDRKICFRKSIETGSYAESIEISIWADSRYYLWVNGRFTATGPSRCWPEFPEKDVLKITPDPAAKTVSIAVLVWHFGTSTSQYIHGPAGLSLNCSIRERDGRFITAGTDGSWLCSEHRGYLRPVPRINVSQAWLEMLNISSFPQNWTAPDFDDSSWSNAVTAVAPKDIKGRPCSMKTMPERSVPLLSSVERRPVNIIREQFSKCFGTGVRIDYKQAFYPGDTTTEDRLQTGYICSLIDSPVSQKLKFILADRIWPETDEFVILNGKKYILAPGSREIETELKEGENLFLLDISGARQRFTSDMHFMTDREITFSSPFPGCETKFIAIGPFETVAIGNIVCADGFSLNYSNRDFIHAGRLSKKEELSEFGNRITPVYNYLIDGAKLRGTGAVITAAEMNIPRPADTDLEMKPSDSVGDHELILDMGVEVSGFLQFGIRSEVPSELDVLFFEYLREDGPEIPDDLDLSLRLIVPSGKSEFRSLCRRGFRYILLRSRSAGGLAVSNLSVDEQLYPVVRTGSFKSDDRQTDQIWNMCRKTVELCSEDALIDSPAFEQAFWTGDAYVMALYHQYLFGDARLIKHSLMLAARSMHYSELPDCHLPAGVHLLLTAWAQLWILAAADYWKFTADRDFIAELYPWLNRAAENFARYINKSGLLKIDAWNMLDWAGMETPYKGTIAHLNARLAECFRAVSSLSDFIGANNDGGKWSKLADELAEASDAAFWDENRGCYIDCIHDDGSPGRIISVQTNLMMMIYGCVPEHRKNRVRNFILNPPPEAVVPGSPFVAHFYYDYLFREGLGQRALNGIKEQWSPMLQQGTCWETFRGFYKDRLTRSYCHAWSSAPSYLFGARILGVQPLEPGFKKIEIAPAPSGLQRAEGKIPMPAGTAYISWAVENGRFLCSLRIPEGTEWLFIPPDEYRATSKIEVSFYTAEDEA